ncbi:hypothetical protein [Saccharothrix lopnurensis]|uniref:Uncharacterized protein n=1 Tax=Saccharothrix lopnurensis TaxID=1670621 RepID=A0ABW1PA11_9PSEU
MASLSSAVTCSSSVAPPIANASAAHRALSSTSATSAASPVRTNLILSASPSSSSTARRPGWSGPQAAATSRATSTHSCTSVDGAPRPHRAASAAPSANRHDSRSVSSGGSDLARRSRSAAPSRSATCPVASNRYWSARPRFSATGRASGWSAGTRTARPVSTASSRSAGPPRCSCRTRSRTSRLSRCASTSSSPCRTAARHSSAPASTSSGSPIASAARVITVA